MPDVRRVRLPYWQWEDYEAGLYRIVPPTREEEERARALLADPAGLCAAMRRAVAEWPLAAQHRLSNTEENRRAWLGWAACLVVADACARATRYAWPRLTDAERVAANAAADRVIAEWEHANAVEPALFEVRDA